MVRIKIKMVDGVATPGKPIPETAVAVVVNDSEFVVYEAGDELPATDVQSQ